MKPEESKSGNLQHESIVFDSPTFSIGSFRCPPASALWDTENISGCQPILVFPRTAVRIRQISRDPVIASPNHVMFYNSGQPYYRELISHRGDVCEFYRLHTDVLNDVLQAAGAATGDQFESPFQFSHGPCPPDLYLLQRKLFLYSASNPNPDSLFLQEAFLRLLSRVISVAMQFNNGETTRRKTIHREKVEAAKEFATQNFRSNIRLEEIAERSECSVFHLCRIFKQTAGLSIHQFISQLRIRAALEEIMETRRCLTDVALDYGYSSHSHFTNAFRNIYGLPPSQLRDADPCSLAGRFNLN